MLQKNSIEVMRMEIKRDYYLNKLITKKHNVNKSVQKMTEYWQSGIIVFEENIKICKKMLLPT